MIIHEIIIMTDEGKIIIDGKDIITFDLGYATSQPEQRYYYANQNIHCNFINYLDIAFAKVSESEEKPREPKREVRTIEVS